MKLTRNTVITFTSLAPMAATQVHHRAPPSGFPRGQTAVTHEGADGLNSLMDFGVLRLPAGETIAETHAKESAWVLIRGEAKLTLHGETITIRRDNVFEEPPSALHLGPATAVAWVAGAAGAEFAVVRTSNERRFAAKLFLPADLTPEYRGAGLVQNACLRNVRLIFDRATRPDSNLVVGEVVNYPGRWSSYPPHHHDQPEIYHYRFTAPHGYGHAELGDDVMKVRDGDTIVIPPGRDHAQVSAPGYGMYYLWMIRHLPDNPYTGFTFAEEHKWTLDARQQGWRPSDLPPGLA
jgi:5-deoxy-glucuronate isomerase